MRKKEKQGGTASRRMLNNRRHQVEREKILPLFQSYAEMLKHELDYKLDLLEEAMELIEPFRCMAGCDGLPLQLDNDSVNDFFRSDVVGMPKNTKLNSEELEKIYDVVAEDGSFGNEYMIFCSEDENYAYIFPIFVMYSPMDKVHHIVPLPAGRKSCEGLEYYDEEAEAWVFFDDASESEDSDSPDNIIKLKPRIKPMW